MSISSPLRRELLDTGIRVATAYPGATATPMMDSGEADDDSDSDRSPTWPTITGIEADLPEINTALPDRRALQELNRRDVRAAVDAHCARSWPRCVRAPQHVIIVGGRWSDVDT